MEIIGIKDFPIGTSIMLRKDFIFNIINKIKKNKISYKNLYDDFDNRSQIVFKSFKDNFSLYYKSYRRLDILLYLCKKLKISFNELEKNIISYKTKRSMIVVNNPKIPIKVSPIFYMLIAHLMGDGGFIRFKTKKTVYSGYRQFNKNLRISFLNKARYVFGDIKFPRDYFETSTRIYLPKTLSLVLLNHTKYNTDNFLSHNARVPYFLNLNKKDLVAFLTALIIDEGNIDSGQIIIRLINKELIEDLKNLCHLLDYECTLGKRSPSGMYNLFILINGVELYWKDYQQIKKEYPFLSMDYKETDLKNLVERKSKFWRTEGESITKNKIIELLKTENLSAKELAFILKVSRQGIKYHLDSLRKNGFVNRLKARRGFKYTLIKYVKFNEKRKGLSKQKNYSKNKILEKLKNKPLSTKELADLINVSADTTRKLLYDLEKINKVKRFDRIKVDTRHYKLIWSLS